MAESAEKFADVKTKIDFEKLDPSILEPLLPRWELDKHDELRPSFKFGNCRLLLQLNGGVVSIDNGGSYSSFLFGIKRVEIRADDSIVFVGKNSTYAVREGGLQHLIEGPEGHSQFVIEKLRQEAAESTI